MISTLSTASKASRLSPGCSGVHPADRREPQSVRAEAAGAPKIRHSGGPTPQPLTWLNFTGVD
jgi:hypothetical protein